MPAEGQFGNEDLGVPVWSKKAAGEFGENPAKFLDTPLHEIMSRPSTTMALIDGIQRIERARYWISFERRLGAEGDVEDAPRDQIVDVLEDRIEYLEEHGEMPNTVLCEDGPPRYRESDHDRPEKPPWRLNGDPWSEHRSKSARSKLADRRNG